MTTTTCSDYVLFPICSGLTRSALHDFMLQFRVSFQFVPLGLISCSDFLLVLLRFQFAPVPFCPILSIPSHVINKTHHRSSPTA
uniref:Uncharacterized protein n=1 Tax=Cucumis sativus TaxID=3659 RepID=A0A0A0KSM5_CUCSA